MRNIQHGSLKECLLTTQRENSRDVSEREEKRGSVKGYTRNKPPDLSAPSLCSIFDAPACELWMVLIENNTVFDNSTGAALQRPTRTRRGLSTTATNHLLAKAATRVQKGPKSRRRGEVFFSPFEVRTAGGMYVRLRKRAFTSKLMSQEWMWFL